MANMNGNSLIPLPISVFLNPYTLKIPQEYRYGILYLIGVKSRLVSKTWKRDYELNSTSYPASTSFEEIQKHRLKWSLLMKEHAILYSTIPIDNYAKYRMFVKSLTIEETSIYIAKWNFITIDYARDEDCSKCGGATRRISKWAVERNSPQINCETSIAGLIISFRDQADSLRSTTAYCPQCHIKFAIKIIKHAVGNPQAPRNAFLTYIRPSSMKK